MRWDEFYKVSYPEESKLYHESLGTIGKLMGWLGLRAAFVCYHLRISANNLDFIRMLMCVAVFICFIKMWKGNALCGVWGLLFMYFQIWIDFFDGKVAKANNKCAGVFGDIMDGMPNDFARIVVWLCMGIFTNNNIMIFLSVLDSYVLIYIYPRTVESIVEFKYINRIKYIYRKSLSAVVSIVAVPLIMVLSSLYGNMLIIYSYFILIIYTMLAVLWLLICTYGKNVYANNRTA